MKKEKVQKTISIFLYMIGMIIIYIPYFRIDGKYYIFYQGYQYVKHNITLIKLQFLLLILHQIIGIFYILTVLLKKNYRLNILATLLALFLMGTSEQGLVTVSENNIGLLLTLFLFMIDGLELLWIKVFDIWNESVKQAEMDKKKVREEKEEERRRLHFPGNYTEMFFQVVWKNFKYNWKDYSLLLMCSTVVCALSLTGIGCYQMMAGIHSSENFLIGQGLGRILWNAMIPMGICAVFLMVFVLVFYLKKWVEGYSIFVTLGIRKKALYIIIALEILFGFIISVLLGCVIGNLLLLLFRRVICHMLGEGTVLLAVTVRTYLKMLGVMIVIYVLSLMACRDIVLDFHLITASTRRICKEKMPRNGLILMQIIGSILIIGSIVLYCQLTRHESIYLMAAFFAGVFLMVRYGGTAYLMREKEKRTYLTNLMKRNHLYHKSRTTAWYLTALIVLHTCAVFYFTFQIVSVTIAEEPESLYPYDFVCIADDGDNEFFSDLKDEYGVEIYSYPMVRVSNADKSEKMEGRGIDPPQGQQIGISETTFHQLKRALDQNYQEESLVLDEEGEKVYIVHQQDRSVKAQPVDWTYGSKRPFLHIGLPCPSFYLASPSKAFTQREIMGEEIGSLIGCFRQGNLENMVVFSDEYFKKAQEMWKYTDIYSGDLIEAEEERIMDVTIKQGPNKLVLVTVRPEYVDMVEEKMELLEQNHTYESRFDAEVNCYYSKQTSVSDMKTEYAMKLVVNFFVLTVMLMASLFLLYIKTASELEEKRGRAAFLRCMGMRRKERIRILKGELYLFYYVPVFITVIATGCFTMATFYARMYERKIMKAYLIRAAWVWLGWFFIEGVYIWILGQWLIRKSEKKDGKL